MDADVAHLVHATGFYAAGENPADYGLSDATLLHIAAYCGSSKAAQKLLEAGADRSATTDGRWYMQATPVVSGNAEAVARQRGYSKLADMIGGWMEAATKELKAADAQVTQASKAVRASKWDPCPSCGRDDYLWDDEDGLCRHCGYGDHPARWP